MYYEFLPTEMSPVGLIQSLFSSRISSLEVELDHEKKKKIANPSKKDSIEEVVSFVVSISMISDLSG